MICYREKFLTEGQETLTEESFVEKNSCVTILFCLILCPTEKIF